MGRAVARARGGRAFGGGAVVRGLGWAGTAVLATSLVQGCGAGHEVHAPWAGGTSVADSLSDATPVDQLVFEVPPPPFRDPEMFPCTECHDEKDLKTNPARRTLSMAHDDVVLQHDQEHRWCLDCHDAGNRDRLRLASGALVPFEESYRLCGQCHGDKYRDWRAGVHGRRTGEWDGKRQYLLCVHCHDSHAPRFKPLAPLPPPHPPRRLR